MSLSHFDTELDEAIDLATLLEEVCFLVIYNDDVNTFDWVIKCLMDVCDHTSEQAEQLSLLIHYKGKATAKTGNFELLKPMKDALVERGLSAVIETEVEKNR
jgi:ATP-dependent Clp protease adaptor protein ClpS